MVWGELACGGDEQNGYHIMTFKGDGVATTTATSGVMPATIVVGTISYNASANGIPIFSLHN